MSATRSLSKKKQAEQHMIAGEKALQTSLFKWSPDFELASSEFHKAANAYQAAGLSDQAIKAYKKAASFALKLKIDFSAGKNFECIAKIELSRKKYKEAATFYQKAGDAFGNAGYNEKMGEILITASKTLETGNDIKNACSVLENALNAYEAEDKEYSAVESYKHLAALYIEDNDFPSAFGVLDRLVVIFKNLEQPHNIHTALFHKIVLLLASGKGAEANEKLNQFMNENEEFLDSVDFQLASDLVHAARTDSKDALQSFMKDHIHKLRERAYAKLIRQMKPLGYGDDLPSLGGPTEEDLILGTPPKDKENTQWDTPSQPTQEITDDDLL